MNMPVKRQEEADPINGFGMEENMKIYNIDNPEKFLDLVKQCKGSVELVSKEGDRLNLKSELTKYLALSKLFTDSTFIEEMELIASDPQDVMLLMDYMMEGK